MTKRKNVGKKKKVGIICTTQMEDASKSRMTGMNESERERKARTEYEKV